MEGEREKKGWSKKESGHHSNALKERKQQQQSPTFLQHQQQAVSRFFFEKYIYISKKKSRPAWSPLCCHGCVLVSLFESAKEENLRTSAHTHTYIYIYYIYKNTRTQARHRPVLVRQTNDTHRLFVIIIFILSSSSSIETKNNKNKYISVLSGKHNHLHIISFKRYANLFIYLTILLKIDNLNKYVYYNLIKVNTTNDLR
jgi:hypothetical protein